MYMMVRMVYKDDDIHINFNIITYTFIITFIIIIRIIIIIIIMIIITL